MTSWSAMNRPLRLVAAGATLGLAVGALTLLEPAGADARPDDGTRYRVHGSDARLVREVVGPVTSEVQGVPASPVDSFVWDGDGVTDARGRIRIDVDPEANSGTIRANWTDRNGSWQLSQNLYMSPPHPTGLTIGSSGGQTVLIEDDPVTTDVWLHGDTGAAEPVLPTLFQHLATWGPAEVRLNGHPFVNVFDGPTPNWIAHVMVSEGVRDAQGRVTANQGANIYSPSLAAQGDVDRGDLEVHLTFHDAPGPSAVEGNFPPPLSFDYHVQFEDVDIDIDHRD